MSLQQGYILSASVPQKKRVIEFSLDLFEYLFPVVENEKNYANKHKRKADSLRNSLLEILYAFSEA